MDTMTIQKQEYTSSKKKLALAESETISPLTTLQDLQKLIERRRKPINTNLYEELKHIPRKLRKEARILLLRKRLKEFEANIKNGKKYYREDLGF